MVVAPFNSTKFHTLTRFLVRRDPKGSAGDRAFASAPLRVAANQEVKYAIAGDFYSITNNDLRIAGIVIRPAMIPPEKLMLFELQNVTKRYGPVTALRDLSVSIPIGAIGL